MASLIIFQNWYYKNTISDIPKTESKENVIASYSALYGLPANELEGLWKTSAHTCLTKREIVLEWKEVKKGAKK